MAPRVLILTGDAAETLEVFYPYQRLLEEGYEVHLAAPEKKKLQFVVHDFADGFDTYTEKLGHTWEADVAFADVNPADYVACVIPGGRAPEYIRNDEDFKRIVRAFFGDDKPGGAAVPRPARERGSRRARRPDDVRLPRARDRRHQRRRPLPGRRRGRGRRLVSGRAWPDHPGWMREFMRLLREHAPVERERAGALSA